jgi:hypothetical protein
MNNALERMWKETSAVTYFKVELLFRHLPEGTEKYHENTVSLQRRFVIGK